MNDPKTASHPGRCDLLKKLSAAFGLAAFGPAALMAVVAQFMEGEYRSRGRVVVSFSEEPFEFYIISLVLGAGALLLTAISVGFAFYLLQGRQKK